MLFKIIIGVVIAFLLLLVWCLCRIAALSQERWEDYLAERHLDIGEDDDI